MAQLSKTMPSLSALLCLLALISLAYLSPASAQNGSEHPCEGYNAFVAGNIEMSEWGNKFMKNNQLDDALKCFLQSLDKKPRYAGTWAELGTVYRARGELDKAIEHFEKAKELAPKAFGTHVNLGNCYKDKKKFDKAEENYQEALRLRPDSSAAINNLGILYYEKGKLQKALEFFQKALDVDSGSADAHYNIGNVMKDHGKLGDAQARYRLALEKNPQDKRYHLNMGIVFYEQGKFDSALDSYERALELDPNYADALFNMGTIYQRQKQYQQALSYLSQAVEKNPKFVDALASMGQINALLNKHQEAQSQLNASLSMNPKDAQYVHEQFVWSSFSLLDWHQYDTNLHRLAVYAHRTDDRKGLTVMSPHHSLHYDLSDSDFLNVTRRYAGTLERSLINLDLAPFSTLQTSGYRDTEVKFTSSSAPPPPSKGSKAVSRLRLGFLSENFSDGHPTAQLLQHTLSHFNPNNFESLLFSMSSLRNTASDGAIEVMRRSAKTTLDLSSLSTEASAEKINRQGAHILFHLDGHMNFASSQVAALHPAPIQVSFLGYPGSLNLTSVSYIISDSILATPQRSVLSHYSSPASTNATSKAAPSSAPAPFTLPPSGGEKLVYMPRSAYVADHSLSLQAAVNYPLPDRSAFGLPQDAFVLCNFNKHIKIDPMAFRSWMNILRRVPHAVLWLLRGPDATVSHLQQEAISAGIDPSRLIFADKVASRALHVQRMQLADLFVGSFHINGHTSILDALWSNLPVVSVPGSRASSRIAASLMHSSIFSSLESEERAFSQVAYDTLTPRTAERYEDRIVELSKNTSLLQSIRSLISRSNSRSQGLFDAQAAASDLEQASILMWNLHDMKKTGEYHLIL